MRSGWATVVVLVLALSPDAGAQQSDNQRKSDRAQLEARFRRELARAVKDRVGLTDQQMVRLGPITERYAVERRRLQMEERDARVAIQRIIRRASAADSATIGELLQRLIDVQKRRVQLVESEQRELATIMTPIQRAKFMALQEQVHRRVERRRGGRPNGGGGSERRDR